MTTSTLIQIASAELQQSSVLNPSGSVSANETHPITVSWAQHLDEVREAQRLRYHVFGVEMGARLNREYPGLDVDLFDDYCEHLIARDSITGQVIGTYRLLTPVQAKRVGSFYSDLEFDLVRLRSLRNEMVELGRSCVHADYRNGTVIMSLWSALGQFMKQNNLNTMIGCVTVPMVDGGHMAASLWKSLSEKHMAPIEFHVTPRLALPIDQLNTDLTAEAPPLVKGYLRLGSKLLGAPAWDPDFNAADLPMMMRLQDLHPRYRKHFLGE